jgi:hypothetical protein
VASNVGDLSASVRRATIDANFEGKNFSQPFVRYSESRVLPRGWCSWQLIYSLCTFMEYFPYRDFLSNQARRRIFVLLLYGRDGGQV